MSLAGSGVIAIWQDLLPEAREDFYEWHNRQHVPERLGIPGFRRGRRFIAVQGSPEFFTLYEADSPDVVIGRDYLDRLNAPTEWTRRVMPSFRNMARSVCRVAQTSGTGEGGYLLTQRFDTSEDHGVETIVDRCASLLPTLSEQTGIVGVHLCVSDSAGSKQPSFEKTFRAAPDIVPAGLIMVEGTVLSRVKTTGDLLARELSASIGSHIINTAIYQLQFAGVKRDAS